MRQTHVPVDIAILYEHRARELDVLCAVKAIIEKHHDLRVEILHWPCRAENALDAINPRLVVLPFCYDEPSSHLGPWLLQWHKSIYFNLAWEQLLYDGNKKAKTPRGKIATDHVIHQAWGNSYTTLLHENGIPSDHVFVNGNPGYYLYHPPYSNYFKTRLELAAVYGLDPDKQWIFFPENYNWAFYNEQMIEMFVAQGLDRDHIQQMRFFCQQSLTGVIRWCERLASDGSQELVIRPRPLTTIGDFQSAVDRIIPACPRHLHIIKGESIREWILASDRVISSYSTSLIDAAVADKPIAMVEPYPIPDLLSVPWHQLAQRIHNYAELLAFCDSPTAQHQNNLRDWARSTMMGQPDGIWTLAHHIADLCLGNAPALPHPTPTALLRDVQGYKRHLPSGVLLWARRIRRSTLRQRSGPDSSVEERLRPDIAERAEIDQMVGRWSAVLRGYHPTTKFPVDAIEQSTA